MMLCLPQLEQVNLEESVFLYLSMDSIAVCLVLTA